jgi:hypothetical protein
MFKTAGFSQPFNIGVVIEVNQNGTVNVAVPGYNFNLPPGQEKFFLSEAYSSSNPAWDQIKTTVLRSGKSLATVVAPIIGGAGAPYYNAPGGGYSSNTNADFRATEAYMEEGSNPYLAQQREELFNEIDADPTLKATVMNLMMAEDSSFPQGPLEAMTNRILARRHSGEVGANWGVRSEVYSGFFGPINRGSVSSSVSAERAAQMQQVFNTVRGGSQAIGLLTDQGLINEHQGRKTWNVGGDYYSNKYPGWAEYASQQSKQAPYYLQKPHNEQVRENIEKNKETGKEGQQTTVDLEFDNSYRIPSTSSYAPQNNYEGIIFHDTSGTSPSAGAGKYNYGVDRNGKIYEYIPGNLKPKAQVKYNNGFLGVAYVGLEGERLTPAARTSMVNLTKYLTKTHNLPPNYYTHAQIDSNTNGGHDHFGKGAASKSGKDVREAAWLEDIRDEIGGGQTPTFNVKQGPPISETGEDGHAHGPAQMDASHAGHLDRTPVANGPFSTPSLGSKVYVTLCNNLKNPSLLIVGYNIPVLHSTDIIGSSSVGNTTVSPYLNPSAPNQDSSGVEPSSEGGTEDAVGKQIDGVSHYIYNTPTAIIAAVGKTGEEQLYFKGPLGITAMMDNNGLQHYAHSFIERIPGLKNTVLGSVYNTVLGHSSEIVTAGSKTSETSNLVANYAQAAILAIYEDAHKVVSRFAVARTEGGGKHAKCPVCNGYRAEILQSTGKIKHEPPQSSSAQIQSGVQSETIRYSHGMTSPAQNMPYCPTCNSSGLSPSTEDGKFTNLNSQKDKELEKIFQENKDPLMKLRNALGPHMNGSIFNAGNTTIGSGTIEYGSNFSAQRIDPIGRLALVGMNPSPNGPLPKMKAIPLVEEVAVPDLGFGNTTLQGTRSVNVLAGAGGVSFETHGNISQTGGIFKGNYLQASISSSMGMMVDGGSGGTEIRGGHIKLSPNDDGSAGSKTVMIGGHAAIQDNLIVAGGGAIAGNLSVPSMTMPGRPGMTEYEYDPLKPEERNPTKGIIEGEVQVPFMAGYLTLYTDESLGTAVEFAEIGTRYYFVVGNGPSNAQMMISPTGGKEESDYPVTMQPHCHPITMPNIDIVKGPRRVPVTLADGSQKEELLSASQAVFASNMYNGNNNRFPAGGYPAVTLPDSITDSISDDPTVDQYIPSNLAV